MRLYDRIGLCYGQGFGRAESKLFVLKPVSNGFDFTPVRSSIANEINKDGLISEVAWGVVRNDYKNKECGQLLLEQGSQNLFLYSNEFIWSGWLTGTFTGTITPNYTQSPDGANNASRIEFNPGDVIMQQSINTSVTGCYLSVWLKSNDGLEHNISFYKSNVGVISTITVTNEWQRFSIYDTNVSTTLMGVSSSTNADIVMFGMQLEETNLTSYIATDNESIPRAVDILRNNNDISSVVNSVSGAIHTDIQIDNLGGVSKLIALSDGSMSNYYALGVSNVDGSISFTSSSQEVQGSGQVPTILSSNKVALVWDSNNVRFYLNGELAYETLVSLGLSDGVLNSINFERPDGNLLFYGRVSFLEIFNDITDIDFIEMTAYATFELMATNYNFEIV